MTPEQEPNRKSQRQGIFVWFFVAFAALAWARCWTNLPWCDEAWFFDTSYNLLTHGSTGVTAIVSKGFPWEGIDRYEFWQPPLFWIIDAAWLKLFGLSLVAFRSLSVLAGVLLLFCWYWLLRCFRAPRFVQLLAMAIIATDYAVVKAGSDGRMDMLAASLGLAAVTVYLKFRETNFALAVLLSQTLLCCGGLTHPMGGLPYLFILAYFFISGKDWQRLRPTHLLLAAAPYLLGAAGWGLYISKDPVTFRNIFLGSNAAGRMNTIFNPLLGLRNEIVLRYLTPFGLHSSFWVVKSKLLIPVVYLASMLAVWFIPSLRRQPCLRPFLAMWTVVALTLLFFDAQRNGTYMVHVFPLYAILLASLTWWLFDRRHPLRFPVAALLAAFILLQVGGSLYLIVKSPFRLQYEPAIAFIRAHSKPGDRIVGSAELGFGLGFDNIFDDKSLGYFVDRKPAIIVLSEAYREWFELARLHQPAIYRFDMNRLNAYQLAFRNETYQVYLPRVQ
jgi:4-amino-4-deoxy-L-arabinose transferase-like glycosyltransferase